MHLALSGDGLEFVSDTGSVRHLAFGTPTTQAIDAMTQLQGPPSSRGSNDECGDGPLDMAGWPSGLTLVSSDGRFVGWNINASAGGNADASARPATLAGVGIGTTRKELASAYTVEVQETTLGTEFSAGGLSGVLDARGPKARIDALWAGTTCVFR